MNAAVLSTKILKPNQRELLLHAGLGLVEQNFIAIEAVPFEVRELPQNIIFTSKNTARIVLKKNFKEALTSRNIFCVGQKTAALLREQGIAVKESADYGEALATKISTNYRNESFLFFCGRKRRPELPAVLKSEDIDLREVIVYDTIPTPKKIHRIFEGVLFFSPSAVKSYCSENTLAGSIAFCIGRSTASEAKKHTNNIKVAKRPSIENVIVQAVKHFRQEAQHDEL